MKLNTVVMGRYTILTLAGTGGMSSVYRARDPDGRIVAVKVLSRESANMAERFRREARLLTDLRHPAIVEFIDTGVTPEGDLFLVMEWLDGVDLADYLMRRRLSLGETLVLTARMARALGYAHRQGIVHRDVKPANIFLSGGTATAVKLLDFGIAHRSSTNRLTRTGVQIGTPAYMAPEQIRTDRGAIDARADVFSLGCVLFECLTRQQAFVGEHPAAVFYKILMDDPPLLSTMVAGLPTALDMLLVRMLAKDRDHRPRDGDAVADEIDRILDALEEAADQLAMRPTASRSIRGITSTEQLLVSVVLLAAAPQRNDTVDLSAPPAESASPALDAQRLQERYEQLGARFDHVADGSLIAVFESHGVAADRAHDAARCALELRRLYPGRAIAVATGRALLGGPSPLGEVIEHAITLLENKDDDSISLDPVTAGFIEARFVIEHPRHDHVARLIDERHLVQPSMLLGQATPFVGRVREMAALEISLNECIEDSVARAVILIGPSGMGKSRLKREFLRKAELLDEGIRVWTAHGQAMNAGSSLDMIAQMIRQQAEIHENEPLTGRQDKLRARIAVSVPKEEQHRVCVFLGELIKTPWPDDDHVQLRAARRDARLMGDQIRRAVQDFLMYETTRQPIVLVLEDLQWSDHATVSLFDTILRDLAQQRFFILALARPEFHESFPGLWAKHDILELKLHRLHERAANKLVRAAVGDNIPTTRLAEIVAQADGNPLFLEELVRSVAAGRQTLPGTVLAMVHARLQALPGNSRRALRAASVFGDRFWRGGLASVLGEDHELDHQLQHMIADELIIPVEKSKFTGEPEYRFRHSLIREAAYGMLTDEDRALAHQLTGHWLERVGEADPVVIAEHFERGGEPTHAIPCLVRGAEHACGAAHPAAAIELAERGVALGAAGEYLGALRAVQAKVYQWQGRLNDAVRSGREAMQRLPWGERAWFEVAEDVVAAQGKLNDVDWLESFAQEVLGDRRGDNDTAGWLILSARLAWMHYVAGNAATANELLWHMETRAASVIELEPEVAARIHATHAIRALIAHNNPAAMVLALQQAIACYREAGDRYNECDQQGNVGFAQIELGLYSDAEATLRAALDTATRLELDELMDSAKHNLGIALSYLGRFDEARELLLACAQAYESSGNLRMAAACHAYLASIDVARLEITRARKHARTAIAMCPATTGVAATSRAMLARILLMRRELEPALHEAREALRTLESPGGSEGDEALIRLVYAEVLYHSGETATARTAIEVARAALLARADKIDHPEWRQSFLSNIPNHARTLELFESWHDAGPVSQ